MFEFGDPKTFWLNVTNIALGVVTGICILFLGKSLFQEIVQRVRAEKRAIQKVDEYSYMVPELGLTMADGGERVDKDRWSLGEEKHWDPPLERFNEEPNIHRSVN
ncbi:MAG: hypothetical protein WBN92_12780 [Terriglobia bacterium]